MVNVSSALDVNWARSLDALPLMAFFDRDDLSWLANRAVPGWFKLHIRSAPRRCSCWCVLLGFFGPSLSALM